MLNKKNLFGFLFSLKTAFWLLCALIAVLLCGAVLMPLNEEYEGMGSAALFDWLGEARGSLTWWLWGAMALLAALTANTLFCSVESLIKKMERKKWLLVVSPQMMHAGFLFILLGHLASSLGGMKGYATAFEGSALRLPSGTVLKINSIKIDVDERGFIGDMRADVEFLKDGTALKAGQIAPNRPSFHEGYGVYLKDARTYPARSVLIEVSREPGAVWALVGAVLFSAGTVLLVALRMGQEA